METVRKEGKHEEMSVLALLTQNVVMFERCEELFTQNHNISCVSLMFPFIKRFLPDIWQIFLLVMLLLFSPIFVELKEQKELLHYFDLVGAVGYTILTRCLNYGVVRAHWGPEETSTKWMRKTSCWQCSSAGGGDWFTAVHCKPELAITV